MRLKWVAAMTAVAVLLGGGAFAGVRWFGRSPTDNALELAPRSSAVYGNVFLDPSMSQKNALRTLLAKLPKYDTPAEASTALEGLVDKLLSDSGLDYSSDVAPWLGSQIAGFATIEGPRQGAYALLLAADDPGAGLDAVAAAEGLSNEAQERSYEGVDYRLYSTPLGHEIGHGSGSKLAVGALESFVVLGNEDGLRAAVDASRGDSLADSKAYDRATEGLSRDRLALFYYDPSKAMQGLGGMGGPTSMGLLTGAAAPGLGAQKPGAAIVYARSDGIVFEASSELPSDDASQAVLEAATKPGLLADLPAGSSMALGVSEIGKALEKLVDGLSQMGLGAGFVEQQFKAETGLDLKRDFLSWMGDLGVSVQGSSLFDLRGGVVIESRDPAASKRAVEAVRRLLEREDAPIKPLSLPGLDGFALGDPSVPEDINVVAADSVVIAYGNKATLELLEPGRMLGDTKLFRRAEESLGDGFAPSAFIDVPAVVGLLESFGAGADDTYAKEVKPLLAHVSYAVAGARLQDDRVIQRSVLGID
ncbi:MAG TPA: DUF3352 domain-containing protein [Actinomycetota bacterium]|nr:DUF3352 domain-containing protein [Actinomycetota bacterium]